MDYNEITNRIDELNLDGYKHIKNNDWRIPDKLISWLEEKRFECIGSGAYSSVWKSETENFIVKVNNGDIDKNYLKFVEFCQQNKGNPHLPKMGQIKKYNYWYIIFIEKLEPINFYITDSIMLKQFVRNFFGPNTSLQPDDLTDKDMFEKLFKRKIKGFHFTDDRIESQNMIDALFVLFKFIVEYNINDMSLDLHGNNIMKRGDTIVITDPVV